MDFGKLDDFKGVDFTLPDKDIFYFAGTDEEPLALLAGATGWSMPKWKGNIYPAGTKQADFATAYSRQFATIEFNTTYYQIPPESLMHRWYDATEPGFIFCPKMFCGISQQSALGIGGAQLPDFLHRMTMLQEKLGLIFMQLPQSFGANKLEALKRFAAHWATGIPLAVELRHPDFFATTMAEQVGQILSQANICWMITDVAGRRDVSHGHITTPFQAIRFVCTGEVAVDLHRIDLWIQRMIQWQSKGVSVVYFFIHTPENLTPHIICNHLARRWKEKTNRRIKIPVIEQGLF